jgi:hypothetical protein
MGVIRGSAAAKADKSEVTEEVNIVIAARPEPRLSEKEANRWVLGP